MLHSKAPKPKTNSNLIDLCTTRQKPSFGTKMQRINTSRYTKCDIVESREDQTPCVQKRVTRCTTKRGNSNTTDSKSRMMVPLSFTAPLLALRLKSSRGRKCLNLRKNPMADGFNKTQHTRQISVLSSTAPSYRTRTYKGISSVP